MKFWYSLLVVVLSIANILAIYYLDQTTDRWFRSISTLIFFIIFLLKYNSSKRLLLVFTLITICDALIVYYEDPLIKKIVFSARILAYLLLIAFLYPKLSNLKFNLFTKIISGFVVLIDIYLLHEMALTIPEYKEDQVFLILFYALGIISLGLVGFSISYLNRYANHKGFLIVMVSIAFVLSDITFYNAYYLDFEVFYYLDRLANILGLVALILFARSWQKSDKKPFIEV